VTPDNRTYVRQERDSFQPSRLVRGRIGCAPVGSQPPAEGRVRFRDPTAGPSTRGWARLGIRGRHPRQGEGGEIVEHSGFGQISAIPLLERCLLLILESLPKMRSLGFDHQLDH